MGNSVIIAGCEAVIFSLVFIAILLLFPDGLIGLIQYCTDLCNRSVRKLTGAVVRKSSDAKEGMRG